MERFANCRTPKFLSMKMVLMREYTHLNMIFYTQDKLFSDSNLFFFTYLKITLYFEILHLNSVQISILNPNFHAIYFQNERYLFKYKIIFE